MKILVSAYSCETGRGSEGEIGWRLILRLAQTNDIFVITRANLQPVHERAFKEIEKPPRLRFVYFDLPWILRFYKRGSRYFLVYYYLWQIGVALKARALAKKHRFDVLHHLIGGMDWMPSGLALAPGVFVWGPIGSENTHPRLLKHLSLASRVKDRLRSIARWFARNLDPFVRYTGARASIILTHTPDTLPRRYAHKMRTFAQTGIERSASLAKPKQSLDRAASLRVIYAGELKDWKGARLALDAALKFLEVESGATFKVVGDGPLRRSMEAAARAHPEGGRVAFLGRLSMDELNKELGESDAFIYPSFHHGLATVVLQAMMVGMPIVCIEGDATSRAVGSRAGITVKLSGDSDPVSGLATALQVLAKNEPERQRLAAAAREIAIREYDYDSMAKELENMLAKAAAVRGAPPIAREA